MVVKFEENILKVVTNITKESVEKGLCPTKVTDDKGNEVYRVAVRTDGSKGSIDTNGIVLNSYVDGKAAFVELVPDGTTLDSIKKKYGQALVLAAKYTESVAAEANASAEAIDAIFTDAQ